MRANLANAALLALVWMSPGEALSVGPVGSNPRKERVTLSCSEVRTRVRFILDLHLKYREFTDELSRRTFQKMFEALDPDRLFLTIEDISRFRGAADRLNDFIGRSQCGFFDEVRALFSERVKERTALLPALVAAPLGDPADPGLGRTMTWAADRRELDERWRRKFLVDAQRLRDQVESVVRERLLRRYTRLAGRHLPAGRDEFYSDVLNSFALSLDPHSAHFLPADQEEFNSRLGTPLDGIGITLSDETDFVTVDSVVKGGVAERNGRILSGDRIVSIDNLDGSGAQSTTGVDLLKVARMVRGKRGSSVRLQLERVTPRGEESFAVTLVREPIRLRSLAVRGHLFDWRGHRLGVLRVPAFYADIECKYRQAASCPSVSVDSRRELTSLTGQRVEGLLLDLRDNAGGDLQESLNLAGLFLPHGPVLQAQDRRLAVRVQEDPVSGLAYGGPMIVLMNRNSASAAEIVTVALQDYGRAVVVGDSRTFGKGTIQVVQDLSNPWGRSREGMLKVTQSKFFGPSGRSTQKRGVEADVVIPSLTEVAVETEDEKDFALEWEEIRPAPGFHPLQDLAPLLAQLRYLSEKRVSANKTLSEIRDRLAHLSSAEKAALREARERDEIEVNPTTDAQLAEAMDILNDSVEISRDRTNWVSTVVRRAP